MIIEVISEESAVEVIEFHHQNNVYETKVVLPPQDKFTLNIQHPNQILLREIETN